MYVNWKFRSLFILPAVLMFVLCGCQTHNDHHAEKHWSYSGSTGPEHWGVLSEDFILAKTGQQQSPVNLTESEPTEEVINFQYNSTRLDLINNGHAIQQNYEKGSSLVVNGNIYELKQFHIHSPSEHLVKGKRYDMEIHLVHQSTSGRIAVASILLQNGIENKFLKKFWNRLPGKSGKTTCDENLRINAADLLPASRSCYTYNGSLTTPPCSEGVIWYVFNTPVTLSSSQLASFQTLYKNNFRPVQPLNGRAVRFCP